MALSATMRRQTRKTRSATPITRRSSDVFCDYHRQRHLLCTDCLSWRSVPGRILHHDRHHHLYFGSASVRRKSVNPACHRGLQTEHFPGLQCGNLYHRTLLRPDRHRRHAAAFDSGKCRHPLGGRHHGCQCSPPCGKRGCPCASEYAFNYAGRIDSFQESSQKRSGDGAAYRVNKKSCCFQTAGFFIFGFIIY